MSLKKLVSKGGNRLEAIKEIQEVLLRAGMGCIYLLNPASTGIGVEFVAEYANKILYDTAVQEAIDTVTPFADGWYGVRRDFNEWEPATYTSLYFLGGIKTKEVRGNLSQMPYIAGSHGESKIVTIHRVNGTPQADVAFIELPSFDGQVSSAQHNTVVNRLNADDRIEVDASNNGCKMVVIAASLGNCSVGDMSIPFPGITIPTGFMVGEMDHIMFEFYPSGSDEHGNHDSGTWKPVGFIGGIFESTEFCGWGNPAGVDPVTGVVKRYTLTMEEYARMGYNSSWFTGAIPPADYTPGWPQPQGSFYLQSNGDVYLCPWKPSPDTCTWALICNIAGTYLQASALDPALCTRWLDIELVHDEPNLRVYAKEITSIWEKGLVVAPTTTGGGTNFRYITCVAGHEAGYCLDKNEATWTETVEVGNAALNGSLFLETNVWDDPAPIKIRILPRLASEFPTHIAIYSGGGSVGSCFDGPVTVVDNTWFEIDLPEHWNNNDYVIQAGTGATMAAGEPWVIREVQFIKPEYTLLTPGIDYKITRGVVIPKGTGTLGMTITRLKAGDALHMIEYRPL